MTAQKDNFENFCAPLSEYVEIIDPRHAKLHICLDEPYLLMKYVSETTRFLGKLLKKQLSEMDPLTEPEKHKALSSIAEDVSKLWASSASLGLEYYLTGILDYLEKKA